jgi:tetratricopeptide (TPR) repeat protein
MRFRLSLRLFVLVLSVLGLGALDALSQGSKEASASQAVGPAAGLVPPVETHAAGAAQPAQPTPEEVGDALMVHQRYQAAISAYQSAQPESATVWNKMGIAHQMMFNQQEALRCYQTSLKLDPHNVHVLNNIGTIYDTLTEYRSAERYYRRALRIEPNSALVHKNLGTNLLAQHKYDKGWESYQTALALDPNIFERGRGLRVDNPASTESRGAMNFYMAKGCVRAGRNERAIEYLRSALNEGFVSPKRVVADSEFASLRGVPAFEQLIAEQTAR